MALPAWKANLMLRGFGMTKVPMIGYVNPKIVAQDDKQIVVRIPLTRRTKNHLRSMYFGALSVGADIAAGWAAMAPIMEAKQRTGRRVDFVFKDAESKFLRRPDGHVHFTCADIKAVEGLVDKALASGERENLPVHVVATVPSTSGEQPVAKFTLTLSIKAR